MLKKVSNIKALNVNGWIKKSVENGRVGFHNYLQAEVGSAIFLGGALSLECYLSFYVR